MKILCCVLFLIDSVDMSGHNYARFRCHMVIDMLLAGQVQDEQAIQSSSSELVCSCLCRVQSAVVHQQAAIFLGGLRLFPRLRRFGILVTCHRTTRAICTAILVPRRSAPPEK